MSTDYNVVGIKPPNEKWKKMKKVWDACMVAEIEIPKDVCKFFNDEHPDDDGVRIELTSEVYHPSVKEVRKDGYWAFVVDLEKLPKDVKVVKFEASY